MLKTDNVHFRYAKRSPEVLKGINMELEKGKCGILLGKNGAGKSTLFSLILGIRKPLCGEITVNDVPLSKMSSTERAKTVAYVPQNITFGALSVFDCVLMGRISRFGLYAGKDDIKIVGNIIDEMGLSSLSGRNADELSGGEKQKVAIARALAQEPKLIIFDEPTGNLDLKNEQLLISQIKKLSEKNITVLTAIHNLNTAFSIGDKFFFLKDGVIDSVCEKDDITEELINDIFDVGIKLATIENQKFIRYLY